MKNGNPQLRKYWLQRHSYFARFDEGIQLDDESWYSVTPEKIAEHIAIKCRDAGARVILDGFGGCGGNTIQFAKYCDRVISVEIDPNKIQMAKHNAEIYGVQDKIEFINGDFLEVAKNLAAQVDVVFLSPPWGGPEYLNQPLYSMEQLAPIGGKDLFNLVTRHLSPNVILYLPRNTNIQELFQLQQQSGEIFSLEQNVLKDRLKTICAYFGPLFNGICYD